MNNGAKERENFCYLLGLNPFREDRYDHADIVKAIDSKRAKWEGTVNASLGGNENVFKASRNLALIPEMRTTMDSYILRRNEFQEGRKILGAKASRLIRYSVVLRDGSVCVSPSAAQKLSSAIAWEGIDTDAVIEAAGIKNIPPPKVVESSIYNAYVALRDIGLWHPYDFVNEIVMISAPAIEVKGLDHGSSCDDFRASFKAIYSRLGNIPPGKIPNQDTYIKTARCLHMTQTDRQIRDLIGFCNCCHTLKPVLDMMDEDSGQPFDCGYIDRLISTYVTGSGIDEELAVRIMEDHCIRKGHPANFSGKESSLLACPSCRAFIPFSDSLYFCPVCGASVRTMCPRCGKIQSSTNRNCSGCGIPVADGRRDAEELDGIVRAYVDAGDIEAAKAQVAKLRASYPKYGQNEELAILVESADSRYKGICDHIFNDSISRSPYSLRTVVDDVLCDFPHLLSNEEIRKRYEEAVAKIREADALCVQAVSKSVEESTDLYIRASEICPDHPDVVAQLRGHPPEGPADATAESCSDCVVLRYSVPEDRRGVRFCIYRGVGSYPEVDASTVPLAETEKGSFSDTTPDPGISYFYRIYSRRCNVLSCECAECGPAVIIREITNVAIAPLEDGLSVRYVRPVGCTRVRVWRKEGGDTAGKGDETEILNVGDRGFEDRGLTGGQIYGYLFVAEYDHDGITDRSSGTVFTGETPLYPEPVDDMIVEWNREDGTYSARWSRIGRVDLYCSDRRMKSSGRTAPLDEIGRIMRRIEPVSTIAGGCTFRLDPGSVLYICPVVPVGRTGVRGTETLVANLRPFRDVQKRTDGTDCLITATWPEGAEEAVLIVGDADDGTATERIVCTRDEYSARGHIRIPMGGASHRNVLMSAVYDVEGVMTRSIGISIDIWTGKYRKVRYYLMADPVKGESERMRVNVRIECKDAVSIPRCVMVLASEGIPLKQCDGEIVWESDEPVVLRDGNAEDSFVMARDKSALGRMRLFFPHKQEYSRYRFVHPLRRL